MSAQHEEEAAYLSRVFTEQLSEQPCGLNDGVQGCAALILSITFAVTLCVDRPPASQRSVL